MAGAAAKRTAAASCGKSGATRRRLRRPAPRIRSDLRATHPQLDRGDDQQYAHRNAYPCLHVAEETARVDEIPHVGRRMTIEINIAAILPSPVRHRGQTRQAAAQYVSDHPRTEEYALDEIEHQWREDGPQDHRAFGPGG